MLKRLIFVALVAAVAAPLSAAETLKKVPARLSPDKAYVLVELRNADMPKMAANIVLARYDAVGGDVRGGARSKDSAVPKGDQVRVAVTNRELVKTKQGRLYLVEMEPDTWVIEGSGGTAFSLGSRSFPLAAGQVVDLGVLTVGPDWREGESGKVDVPKEVLKAALFGAFVKKGEPRPWKVDVAVRGASDIPVPTLLAAKAQPASFTSGAKFGNYLGGLVNRMDGRKGRLGAAEDVPASAGATN